MKTTQTKGDVMVIKTKVPYMDTDADAEALESHQEYLRRIKIPLGQRVISASRMNILAGSIIRDKRIQAKLSQCWLADALGICSQQLGKYEKGAVTLTIFRIAQICHYLNMKPEDYINQIFKNASMDEEKTNKAPQDLESKVEMQ